MKRVREINRIKGNYNIKCSINIFLLLIIVAEIWFYSYNYYSCHGLCFTKEDWFIFGLMTAFNIIFVVFEITKTFYTAKLWALLGQIYEAIISSEDNNVEIQRDTQDLIIKLFKKGKK